MFFSAEVFLVNQGGGTMSTVKQGKERQIVEIKERFENAKSVVVTDYRGINVADMTALRKQLRDAGVEYKVLKNTYIKIATEEMDLDELDEVLQGPTAIAFSYDDAVSAAKVISEFNKSHGQGLPKIKAGVLEGNFINVTQVVDLANLPPKDVLLSMVLRTMQAPITSFVRTNNNVIAKLFYAINAIKDQKEAI